MQAFKWSIALCRGDITKVLLPVVVVGTVVMFATLIVPKVLGAILRSGLGVPPPQDRLDGIAVVQYLVGTLLAIATFAYAAASLYPYLLNLARGRPVELAEAFRPGPHLPNALKLTAILFAATTFGSLLCALPGIAVIVVTATAFPAMVDRDLDVLTALRESFEQARAHLVPFLIFGLLCVATTLFGAALCIVGVVLVSLPVVLMAQVFVYLRLEGEAPVGMDLA